MSAEALLIVQNATVSYNGRPAVENVSFSLAAGENLCLVGPNGSGKSSLLMGILGLRPLDRGSATLAHGPNSVAYLAQMHTTERDFPATAWEIVLSGTQTSGRRLPFYTKADRERAREAMALLKIESLARSRIGRLSGGQQQRVLIARAIARRPQLLVMDEPCSALDPAITEELYELFAQLKRDMRLAMLLSTHDWRYVAREADTVLELNRTVDFYGTAAEWRARKGGPDIG